MVLVLVSFILVDTCQAPFFSRNRENLVDTLSERLDLSCI